MCTRSSDRRTCKVSTSKIPLILKSTSNYTFYLNVYATVHRVMELGNEKWVQKINGETKMIPAFMRI